MTDSPNFFHPVTGALMHRILIAMSLVSLKAEASIPTINPHEVCKMPSAVEQKLERKGLRCPATAIKMVGSTQFCIVGTPPCDEERDFKFVERVKEECLKETGQPCPLGIELDPAHNTYRTLCGPPLPEVNAEPSHQEK
jgi:hypothetical protein